MAERRTNISKCEVKRLVFQPVWDHSLAYHANIKARIQCSVFEYSGKFNVSVLVAESICTPVH